MRISTAQFYFQNTQQITNQQSSVNSQVEHISTGREVLSAKDDAVSYGTLSGYKDQLNNIDKYERNLIQAESRNSLLDTSFISVENSLQSFQTLFIQSNNGGLSNDDLSSIASQVQNVFDQIIDTANTRDETGGYIFSGFQIDTLPFTSSIDNTVTYQGDNGERELQIASNVLIDTNISGDNAFQNINNAIGDFSANYTTNTSGITLTAASINDLSLYDTTANPPGFTFDFASPTDLTVTDANGTSLFSTTTYEQGQVIPLSNGVDVQIDGNPLPGDSFTLERESNISVFDTLQRAINLLEAGSTLDAAQRQTDYAEIIEQVDSALNHFTSLRAESGIRLQLVDSQRENHLDEELYLETGRSRIEDLDFAQAVSAFEQSTVALQAAQQTFVRIEGLSLFNFL